MTLWIISKTTHLFLFQALVLLIISCYGGGFACIPAYLADLYGIRQLSTIHGPILTAWGLAGIAGPMVITFFRQNDYGYDTALQYFAGLFIIAFIVASLLQQFGKPSLSK